MTSKCWRWKDTRGVFYAKVKVWFEARRKPDASCFFALTSAVGVSDDICIVGWTFNRGRLPGMVNPTSLVLTDVCISSVCIPEKCQRLFSHIKSEE